MDVATCKWCREPLNEGAVVCRACRRKQPLPEKVRDRRIAFAILAVFAVAVIGFLVYAASEQIAEDDAVARICIRAKLAGNDCDRDAIRGSLRALGGR